MMTNGEKYRDKLLKFIEERDAGSFTFSKGEEGKFWQCGGRRCSECGMSKERSNCTVARLKWLLSEYKEPVKLSGLEYRILKYCLSKNYNHISRRGIGNMLIVSEYKLKKNRYNFIESDGDWTSICLLDDLFQFVKLGDDSTSIKDVLNNCEVVDDE